MTPLRGHAAAAEAFTASLASGALHHAWLITGQEGIGKATFAKQMARELVGGGPQRDMLIDARSHPDYKLVVREVWDKSSPPKIVPHDQRDDKSERARTIRIAQMRMLQAALTVRPSLGQRRAIVIDAADELELAAANALLKSLEEPPVGTTFFLVSHAPGRLLPTIRSRCRVLRLEPLDEEDMRAVLRDQLPAIDEAEIAELVRVGAGSPGRALGYAGLDVGALDEALHAIGRDGDRSNARRVKLARALGTKAAQPRYEAFLERVPATIVRAAATRAGEDLRRTLDAYDQARRVVAEGRMPSADATGIVFELATIVAGLAAPPR